MYKLIYVDVDLGYKIKNTLSYSRAFKEKDKLAKSGIYVICLFDDNQTAFLFKAIDFHYHESFVNQCFNLDSILITP